MFMKDKILIVGVSIGIIILVLSGVCAKDYFLVCLNEGETIEFSLCNPNMNDRTCDSNSCRHCTYIGSRGFYCPASLSKCNALGLTCSSGNHTLDKIPPNILNISLKEGAIYEDDRLDFVGEADEIADWYYSEDGLKWKKMCSEKIICEDRVSFRDGQNDISIKVEDVVNNAAYMNISFFVDEKFPKIKKILPKKKSFFDGNFYIKFNENNPKELIFYYGNDNYEVDINSECVYDGKKYYECDINVDLEDYDGQEIEYWFVLEDIADNIAESKHVSGKVDTTSPVINNNPHFYEIDRKYVYFDIDITEENFDKAFYNYIDSRGRVREKKLCSRLKDGRCEKKKSFKRGEHNITVQVSDEAGNSVGVPISFVIDY